MFMSRHGRAPLELSARPGFPFQAAAYGRCVAAATAGRAELRKDACAQEFEALRACVARASTLRGCLLISPVLVSLLRPLGSCDVTALLSSPGKGSGEVTQVEPRATPRLDL
ncbi:hypothetical protein Y1Q_0020812 [Alligator mississippiensis]|uniref:NADH dehydrogenase [ubiquinone] 1 alpha subcomplex assembly factor 8 n=1 Tax=Alligator mississippiensis TaxID=8496 RepID=A0A151MPX2_ALLMI|nr:hypothetical protein Y1Q_0020812 [Alligator mississippiensis]